MLKMTLAAMGLDADAILSQANALGESFAAVVQMQRETIIRLKQAQASLDMMAAAMGLTVPPPEGDALSIIEAETAAHLSRFGGLVEAQPEQPEQTEQPEQPEQPPPRRRLRLLGGKTS